MNIIISNKIMLHLIDEEYIDKGYYKNEFKEVIGDKKVAYDISNNGTLIFGGYGLLLVFQNAQHHGLIICDNLKLITLDIFLKFSILFVDNK